MPHEPAGTSGHSIPSKHHGPDRAHRPTPSHRKPSCVVSWLFQANVIAASAARLAGVPRVVASVRNMSTWKSWPGFRRWWYWLADRLTAPLNDVIFANSRAAANDFVRWTRRPDLPIEVVPNGLDVDALLAAP